MQIEKKRTSREKSAYIQHNVLVLMKERGRRF
jgi:hypothetical protein